MNKRSGFHDFPTIQKHNKKKELPHDSLLCIEQQGAMIIEAT